MKRALILNDAGVAINAIIVSDEADLAELGVALMARLALGPDPADIGWIYDGNVWSAPLEPEPSLDDLRAVKLAAVASAAEALLVVGAPVGSGLHVALDDGSRADLTAMAATATAAATGALDWPESYSRGWITIENTRIPLTTPAAGLSLAAMAGNYYAALVQYRRDLKDAALAATDAATLDALDVTAGWPG